MKVSEDLRQRMQHFSKINEHFGRAFQNVQKNAKLGEDEKYDYLFFYLATALFVYPQFFNEITREFPSDVPKLLHNALFSLHQYSNYNRRILNSILLVNAIKYKQDFQGYALKYFNSNPSIFDDMITVEGNKKRKIQNEHEISDLEIVETCHYLLQSNPDFYRNKWKWSVFIEKYLDHENPEVRWTTCRIIAILLGMNESYVGRIMHNRIPSDLITKLNCNFDPKKMITVSFESPAFDKNNVVSYTNPQNEGIENISGIYLPVISQRSNLGSSLVEVPSTKNNLRKIALALTSNRAICLQGPVGSGKTSLVEYLAQRTGRSLGEDFVKVQLGDETDGKMLLGTYRCTDIPGEFVWQPGVLTQAVLEGHWLLLEDIDTANMDIATILASLLENNTLTVPGYRDTVSVTPGFQLFLTQRYVSTISGHHKKRSNSMALLEKHVSQINIDPLAQEELLQILNTRYIEFRTITDRMLSVFSLFNLKPSDTSKMSVPRSGRLISTRDFFKWCSRAIIDFDVTSQASALKVLQDAIDVFCCSFANTREALELAKQISTHLGIINHKAEYFFNSYKPIMRLTTGSLIAGRATLPRENNQYTKQVKFSFTRPSAVLLERIMSCVTLKEPVLLVGETGTGKTSCIQYLAHTIGQKLVVINMNQQSDSADLLGGFKPVEMKLIVSPVRKEFEQIFCDYFKVEPNRKYLSNIALCFNTQRWPDLVKLMTRSYQAALGRLKKSMGEFEAARDESMADKYEKDKEFLARWRRVGEKLQKLDVQLRHKSALAFAFIEGSLVRAVESGHWVLLDEINLANAETLECLSGLLEGSQGSLCLLERGDKRPVRRHPNFTLFACMNPSTDVGKKDLPAGLRNRFTEFFIDELNDRDDLLLLVGNYLDAMSLKGKELDNIVGFYLKVRMETINSLSDGLGHKPHFSLRSLCRALVVVSKNPCGTFKRSLYEAFCLSFLTQLDSNSYQMVEKMISSYLIGDAKSVKAVLKQPIPEPKIQGDVHLQFEGYWVRKGNLEPSPPEDYILTQSVRRNLKDLVRVVSIGKLPVLLQGDTSVGKTSLITYLARASGNRCVRINNHEHTDLQEYVGSYAADAASGRLAFREGVLVEAMRLGHWVILDELNLAPTEVLEALNRVLDDNREIFIPETQQTVRANPNFMLFATQNPPGAYGGRKVLSRAFRNRFVELHFDEIPADELEFILHQRCRMAQSYAKKMVAVMTDLQMRRRGSAAFAGKQGFITLRDLFRWGERYRLAKNTAKLYDWDQHLADEGYLVLAGRVRRSEEKGEIIEVLQKHLKRAVVPENLFTLCDKTSSVTRHILEVIEKNKDRYQNIVWTYNMRQLAVLVSKALEFKEPVLLVGETGGGKTTVAKLIAENNGQGLVTVNCHMHTESSDFIGGLRPVRDHTSEKSTKLFEWIDGPLIDAMVQGQIFLADEISLADDSVLERLNSLLEPERSLLLAEKGIDLNNRENSELIVAHPNFFFIGTMNPGGDFGKKELSPALRNRFTEIWCETCRNRDDLVAIIEQNIKTGVSMGNQEDCSSGVGNSIMDFVEWFEKTEIGKRFTISIRDILTWVNFLNTCADNMEITEAYIHGAYLTFLDSLGSGITSTESPKSLDKFKADCRSFLTDQTSKLNPPVTPTPPQAPIRVEKAGDLFGIKPFYIQTKLETLDATDFAFNAPTTLSNTLQLLRGMQLNKAVLLEGSPGVGKTSLVTALAKVTGHELLRVNLSDQTDISDLFGADLPVEGGSGGQFSWRDGPLLQALKNGHWVLLDELNLASQSVLEGLNACLDHRGEIFIPELGKTFHVKSGTKFFGCQNPLRQGGSRRGLPQSFLNRFIQVYVSSLNSEDLFHILSNQFRTIPSDVLWKMIEFNDRLAAELDSHAIGNKGAPWECNLRDLTRWCEATLYLRHSEPTPEGQLRPQNLVQLVYADRMRTPSDRQAVSAAFGAEFGGAHPLAYLADGRVQIGDVALPRAGPGADEGGRTGGLVLRSQLAVLRSLAYCVNLNWMAVLVGSSGCGKSGVVKTLANLAGKTLKTLPVTSAMDTTDILGGFEQTDYSRHLEEIAKTAERLSLEAVQELIVSGRTREAVEVIARWEAYRDIRDSANLTMEEEIKLFLRKLAKVEEAVMELKKYQSTEPGTVLRKLEEKLNVVGVSVKKEGSLNAGGKFEWVDSILVKCLQNGFWLLVDNVNLCSSAVLDRLNALLEPNGVLTISERGVDENGRMVEIKPHKDFRMFFTMDPKNGEISRAMRNRGIEIYILNEHETKEYNELDRLALINLEGMRNTKEITSLNEIHCFISDLVLGEKPTVKDLLQAASLIAQQIGLDKSTVDVFTDTIIEVYYKTRSAFEFDCDDPIGVIKNEVQQRLNAEHALDRLHGDVYDDNLTLKTSNIRVSSKIEKVKQQATALLKHMGGDVSFELLHRFVNYYSISSIEDLSMRHCYIKSRLDDLGFHELLEDLFEVTSGVDHPECGYLPLDNNWTPDAFHLARNTLQSNQLNLALFLTSFYFLERHEMKEAKLRSGKTKSVTLLDYMHQRGLKKIEDKFNDVVIDNYPTLIKEFDKFLLEMAPKVTELTDKDTMRLCYLASWRFSLHKCTLTNIKSLTPAKQYDILAKLSAHYKWFYKFCINELASIARVSLPEGLSCVLRAINSKLDRHFSLMQKLGSHYQKHSNRPFIDAAPLAAVAEYNGVKRCYDLCHQANDVVKILGFFRLEPRLKPLLVEVKSNLGYASACDLGRELQELHEKCSGSDVKPEIDQFELKVLPVLDVFTQLQVRTEILRVDHLALANDILVPPELSGALALYHRERDPRLLSEITRLSNTYLMYSASCRPGEYLGTPGEGIVLSCFNPRLAYYFNHLLVNIRERDSSNVITLGNFRDRMKLHDKLGGVLWGNMLQLSEQKYDNLYAEKRRVIEMYEKLVEELFKSMKINYSKHQPLQALTVDLVDALRRWQHASTLLDPQGELQSFVKRLERSSENLTKLQKSSDPNENLLIISDMYMDLSYTKAILNSKLTQIDPLVKRISKRDYCSASIAMFEGMKRCYEEQNAIYSDSISTRHAYCESIEGLIEELDRKKNKYVSYNRSAGARYEPVLKVVGYAFSTILSEEHVTKMMSTLNSHIEAISCGKNVDRGRFAETLRRHESMVASYENLIHEWNTFWGGYPDVVEPLMGNVTEFIYGLRMKVGVLRKCLAEHEFAQLGVDINGRMLDLVRLPVLNEAQSRYESYLDVFVDKGFSDFVDHVLDDAEYPHVKVEENFRLLKCGMQESFNNCVIDAQMRNSLTKEAFLGFNSFINVFVGAYNKYQEEKEAKEKEEGNLYKMKTKCDDKTEEEQSEEELKELFPNYHGIDFEDFQKTAVLSDDPEEQEKELKHVDVISYGDLSELVQLHVALMNNFTKTEWLNPGKNKTTHYDFLRPVMEKFKTFARILEKSVHSLDYTMDNKILGSLSVLLAVTKSYGDSSGLGDQPTSPTRSTNKKASDFYRDSNVEEIKSCYHILEELKSKTNELLNEWPDQPTLKTIISVIERISSFDINSPVSRFLTGFEILLTKCHEWEQVAHSAVSLSHHHRDITEQIISWRKLEFAMWKDLLNRTYERANEPLTKWWLYLFNIMEQFIVAKMFPVQELIETLQNFLTKSSLAEFHGRLDLIRAFHCHATYLDRTKESTEFISILWNLHSYFQQFSTAVSNKIKDLRSPIEKKLKEYVKIVRWKDINYWAIKETVDKSHRTLHKYMKEFRDVLLQPVTSCLHNTNTNTLNEYVGIWDRPQRQSPKTYHYTLDPEAYMAKQSLVKKINSGDTNTEIEGILSKIESYFLKSRKLCKETISATKYPSLVQGLDSFITTVIETSSHLQNLEVDKNIPKEKQKGQAKSILQRKHRALADLFKTLSKIGLSFRTGIIESKMKNPASDFVFKPINLNANFSFINHGKTEEKILTIWDSCELYYVRSLMRADVLETAMKNPAKDLGLQNIERCKGFSTNLLTLAQDQKSILTESTRIYSYLRYYSKQMNESCEGKTFLHITTLENIVILLKNIGIVMNQYKIILNSCPEENIFDKEVVPILETKIKERILQKHDALWSKAASSMNEIMTSSTKLSVNISKWKGSVCAVEYELVVPKFVSIPDAKVVYNDLSEIQDNIASLKLTLGNTAMTRSLAWLESEITKAKRDLHSEHDDGDVGIDVFKKRIESYAEQMLLVMQTLFKKYAQNGDTSKEEPVETEDEQLGDDQLKKSLVGDLAYDFALLDMKKILRKTNQIADILLGLPPKHAENHKAMAAQVMPILEQLLHLYQYFITQQVSTYRVTCKMASVLLNVFIELASKGFCIPPEFSDEMDGEGISKPSDGLGLGEGEGEKDVSDKIESEDQLDDAQPAGEEKEKDEDGDCKEEEKGIEMSEDFDSKLQDKEKKEDDESGSDSGDSDAEEQMGETEKGAEQLDQEIWGSDEEEGDDQEEGSEQKEEKGDKGEKEGEDQLGAKEDSSKTQEERDDKTSSEEKEKNKKDINEMDEPEFDDDQIDPHHGNQPELPEPEPMDLPDDLQLDEGEEKDGENQEENPFDIDAMKEQNVPEEKTEDGEGNEDENKQDEAKDFSSDDEEITRDDKDDETVVDEEEPKVGEDDPKVAEDEDNGEKEAEESKDQNEEAESADQGEDKDETGLDQTQSHQENVEAMEVDQAEATDKTQPNQSETQKSNLPIDEICQEDKPDQEGVGQSQMEESSSGHSAQTSAPQEMKSAREEQKEDQKRKQKPGESDSQRSLGDINEPVKKKLKTIDAKKDDIDVDESSDNKQDETVEMYQHIKDAKDAETQQMLDAATKEQAESQKKEAEQKEGEDNEDIAESSKDLPQEESPEEMEVEDTAVEKSEKVDGTKDKKTSNEQHPEGDVLEDLQDIDIEGDIVETSTAARNTETSHHTLFANISETTATRLSMEEINALRLDVEHQLSAWHEPPSSAEAEQAWQKISSVTSSLAQDLSEQLRLVLEPTQASRLRGDFRTGRRINMRKVIPYIASQFRKDKIWLRRTKPSKREYQIVLAIDDSSSMADNHSRELAFESVALISRALTLLESGQLSVVSFGESTRVLHKLAEQFTDRSGVMLLQEFQFDQSKTCVAKLVDFATEMFEQSQLQSGALNAKLLVIVSDGRGVFSEGESVVRQAVRRGKLANIFTVFVIIDNPENKNSVLDIRMPVFKDGKLLGIHGYMDVFPFSFYIILRDINSLPNVLSDALRQWFEVVSNLDK